MSIHVHDEIVHEDEEDSSSKKKNLIYFEQLEIIVHTFMATASKAPSVGWPRSWQLMISALLQTEPTLWKLCISISSND